MDADKNHETPVIEKHPYPDNEKGGNSQSPCAETRWIFATLAGLRFSVVISPVLTPFETTVAVPVQSANSRPFIVTLETNLCHIFGFLGHLQSENDVCCLAKALNNGQASYLMNFPFSLPPAGFWFSWGLQEQPLSKSTQDNFWLRRVLHLLLCHLPS